MKFWIFSFLLLSSCAQAPTLSESAAQTKMNTFLETAATDLDAAYASTAPVFQEKTDLETFKSALDPEKISHYTSFSITNIAYQQGVGINAAKVDGDIIYTDLTKQSASFIWSYNNETQDWYLDAFRFN